MRIKCLILFSLLFFFVFAFYSCSQDFLDEEGLGNTGGGGVPQMEKNTSAEIPNVNNLTIKPKPAILGTGLGNTGGGGVPQEYSYIDGYIIPQ